MILVVLEVHMVVVAVVVIFLIEVSDTVVVAPAEDATMLDSLTSSVKFVLNMDTLSMFVILRLI